MIEKWRVITVKAWEIRLVVKGGSISALKQPDNEQTGAGVSARRTKGKAGSCTYSTVSSGYVSKVSVSVTHCFESHHLHPSISTYRITLASLSLSESKLLPNALWSIRICTYGIKNEAQYSGIC